MRDEKLGYVNHLMLLLQAMVFLLCIGLLLSFSADGGSLMVVPPRRSSPVRLESPPAESSSGRHNARIAMEDLIYASKRKVPKGPDPIHNRCMESWKVREAAGTGIMAAAATVMMVMKDSGPHDAADLLRILEQIEQHLFERAGAGSELYEGLLAEAELLKDVSSESGSICNQ
ncbi:hypothetical protein M5K25_019572 [Dendrobium thyrsiflorum]|uniref:Uncharacterized protein n=1 Tax=Dendrobium thyrsiflorum TaxID=117978 RepID=A0ABD0UFB0_DENTH